MCASRLPFSTAARRQGLQKAEHELSELWDGPCLVLLEPGGAGRGVVLVKQARGGAGIQHMALVGMVAAQGRAQAELLLVRPGCDRPPWELLEHLRCFGPGAGVSQALAVGRSSLCLSAVFTAPSHAYLLSKP